MLKYLPSCILNSDTKYNYLDVNPIYLKGSISTSELYIEFAFKFIEDLKFP